MFKVRAYIVTANDEERGYSTKCSVIRNIKTIEKAREVAERITTNAFKNPDVTQVFGDIIHNRDVVDFF